MNELESFDNTTFAHDDNGNLTDDGERLFTYDSLNRIIQIHKKSDNSLIATYKYDFANRRISKKFKRQEVTECNSTGGEATPDANTLVLYHYNNATGPIIDSSGNGNDISNPKNTTREDGLFNTRSLRFNGQKLKLPLSSTLDNIQDKLTVETFVFLNPQNTNNLQDLGGPLVKRKNSFNLKISRGRLKPVFVIHTFDVNNQVVKTKVKGNVAIPLATWVHIAGVYDGQSVKIFVNGTLLQEKPLAGNVAIDPTVRTFLGNSDLAGNLEETRISNIDRVGCAPGGVTTKDVLRSFFYRGWQVLEERERIADVGQSLGTEVVSRQYVDGAGIDEHLQMIVYDETGVSIAEEKYYHQNHRDDVVAISDIGGNVVFRFEYTTYGEIFEINSDNELEEFTDFEEIVYGFHGRRIDEETSLLYYRNRYYNQRFGRFLQRDPLGYVDSFSLYEAFLGNSYYYSDPKGLSVTQYDLGGVKIKIDSSCDSFCCPEISNDCINHDYIKNIFKKTVNTIKAMPKYLKEKVVAANVSGTGISQMTWKKGMRFSFANRFKKMTSYLKENIITIKCSRTACQGGRMGVPMIVRRENGKITKIPKKLIYVCCDYFKTMNETLKIGDWTHELAHVVFGLDDPMSYGSENAASLFDIHEYSMTDGSQVRGFSIDEHGSPFSHPAENPESYSFYVKNYLRSTNSR